MLASWMKKHLLRFKTIHIRDAADLNREDVIYLFRDMKNWIVHRQDTS